MSSSERPIGTAKGKQANTEALCQRPPPNTHNRGPSTPLATQNGVRVHLLCLSQSPVSAPAPTEHWACGANKIGQNCWLDTRVVVVVV